MKALMESFQTRTERIMAVGSEECAALAEADEIVAQFENRSDGIVGWVSFDCILNSFWSDCRTERRKKVGFAVWKHREQLPY